MLSSRSRPSQPSTQQRVPVCRLKKIVPCNGYDLVYIFNPTSNLTMSLLQ
jgi:hypothetical protein